MPAFFYGKSISFTKFIKFYPLAKIYKYDYYNSMKFNKNRLIEAIRNFSINFAVASFALGVFQNIFLGYLIGIICIITTVLTCSYKNKGE